MAHDHANGNETKAEPDDAMTMLTADHRQVRTLFQPYEDTPDPYLKQIIAEHVFAELALHALLEETIFYPALAELADPEGRQLVDDALHDHQRVRDLMADLREIDDDAAFEARFHALRDHVDQHIEDEETTLFPQAGPAGASQQKHTVSGFDHGVGHPSLLLDDAKAPNCRKIKAFNDFGQYSAWPKVADTVIKARFHFARELLPVSEPDFDFSNRFSDRLMAQKSPCARCQRRV